MAKKINYTLFILLCAYFFLPQNIFAMEKLFYLSQKNAEEGVKSINENWKKIDIVAPQMYSVGSNLSISGSLGPKLKKTIKDYKLKVMPLVVNAGFSRTIIQNLLQNSKAQDDIIKGLVYLAKKNNYIGWQFDFENIDYKDKDSYSAFVEKTYKEFKKNNLSLSVAAVARFVDFEDTETFRSWSGVYDFKRIAESSDFVSLMVYDDPKSKGPVASMSFTNKCVAYAKDKIPAEKLSLGVPLYYWKWSIDESKRLGSGIFKDILTIMENARHVLGFDKELGAAWLTYTYNNKNYAVWFENAESFSQKMRIIKNNNFRGFSAWLIGGEDPAIWDKL